MGTYAERAIDALNSISPEAPWWDVVRSLEGYDHPLTEEIDPTGGSDVVAFCDGSTARLEGAAWVPGVHVREVIGVAAIEAALRERGVCSFSWSGCLHTAGTADPPLEGWIFVDDGGGYVSPLFASIAELATYLRHLQDSGEEILLARG